MRILGMKFGADATKIETPKSRAETAVGGFSFSRLELPRIGENKSREWLTFGDKDEYPDELMKLFDSSSIHAAIITSKSKFTAGDGITVNGQEPEQAYSAMDPVQAIRLRSVLDNALGKANIHGIFVGVAFDWQLFGAIALKITWRFDGKTIESVDRISPLHVRCGRPVDGEIETYYVSKNFKKYRNPDYAPVVYSKFEADGWDPKGKTSSVQLLYVANERPDVEHYGIPSYRPCLSWIKVDSLMSDFHASNIQNGFNPNMMMTFFGAIPTPDQKQFVLEKLKQQFSGVENAGKAMVFWAENKESAPEIKTMEMANLDKMFIQLSDTITQQILSGHRVTTPNLLGIPTGKLFNADEFSTGVRVFQSSVINPDMAVLESVLNRITGACGITAKIGIKKFDPLAENVQGLPTGTTPAATPVVSKNGTKLTAV